MLKYAILGFLGYGPMTGYEIKQRMDRSTTHFWHAKLSQIYTTLGSLEKDGFVRSSVVEQTNKPDKRLYTLTEIGQADFSNWLNEPYSENSPKKETLVLKMFFAAKMNKTSALTQLQIQLDIHRKQLAYYRTEVVQDMQYAREEFPALKKDAEMWESTRLFGERYEALYVQWIEEMIEKISSKPQT
jgi:PadR family transcriptional regulator, regulatory protein AphA